MYLHILDSNGDVEATCELEPTESIDPRDHARAWADYLGCEINGPFTPGAMAGADFYARVSDDEDPHSVRAWDSVGFFIKPE